MPSPAACRHDASGIERFCYSPQRCCPGLLSFPDNGQNVRGVLISASLDGRNSIYTGLGELRAPESDAARLSSRKSLSGPRRYQGALFLGQRGKEVQECAKRWPKSLLINLKRAASLRSRAW